MVTLEKIKLKNYDDFKQQVINDFADQSIKSDFIKKELALSNSKKEFKELLPQGLKTKGNTIKEIIYQKKTIGYLWYVVEKKEKTAFIFYMFIKPEFRQKKSAQKAIKILTKDLKKKEIETIELHVYIHNKPAIGLYERSGFKTTGIFMKKKIK